MPPDRRRPAGTYGRAADGHRPTAGAPAGAGAVPRGAESAHRRPRAPGADPPPRPRRPAAPGGARRAGRARGRGDGGGGRRALPRARTAAAAGRAQLHPRGHHAGRRRHPAGAQRRASPQATRRNRPAVPRRPRGARRGAGAVPPRRLLVGRAAPPIPRGPGLRGTGRRRAALPAGARTPHRAGAEAPLARGRAAQDPPRHRA